MSSNEIKLFIKMVVIGFLVLCTLDLFVGGHSGDFLRLLAHGFHISN